MFISKKPKINGCTCNNLKLSIAFFYITCKCSFFTDFVWPTPETFNQTSSDTKLIWKLLLIYLWRSYLHLLASECNDVKQICLPLNPDITNIIYILLLLLLICLSKNPVVSNYLNIICLKLHKKLWNIAACRSLIHWWDYNFLYSLPLSTL